MKKLLLFMLMLTLSFALVACGEDEEEITCDANQDLIDGECVDKEPEVTDADLVAEAKAALVLSDLSQVVENVVLPSEGMNGTTIEWESSNTMYFTSEGVVTRPGYAVGDMPIQITATISLGNESETKTFDVTIIRIPAEDEVASDFDEVSDLLGALDQITENVQFLEEGGRDTEFTYESSNTDVLTNDGIVFRPGHTEEDAAVTLTVTAELGDYTEVRTLNLTVPKKPDPMISETINMPFISLANEWTLEDGELNIHYLNDGNIPYVDVQEYINRLDGALVSNEMTYDLTGSLYTLSYVYEAEDEFDEDYVLINTFDAATNVMTVNTMAFFGGLTAETSTDFGSDLVTVDTTSTDPIEVVIDLDDYNMDVVLIDDVLYMPFHLANFFYSGSMFNTYYNGEEILAIDAWQLDAASVISKMKDTELVDQEMPDDMKKFTYNFLVFTYDLIYGLKEDKGIESAHDYMNRYLDNMVLGDNDDVAESIFKAQYRLDDLHSGHILTGYYDGVNSLPLSLSDLGEKSRAYYNYYFYEENVGEYCDTKLENVSYVLNGDASIAVVHITGFSKDDDSNVDTARDFGLALDEIQALGTVNKIVVDLSCNGGGTIGIALQILGYMTEDPITVYSKNPTDLTEETWTTTSTAVAVTDVEWYIMTSPMTFSAANLVTSIAKDQGLATIIGQQSSGGACSVAYVYLPDGTIVNMSSDWMLTNDQFESIESGIPVDIEVLGLPGPAGTLNFDVLEEAIVTE